MTKRQIPYTSKKKRKKQKGIRNFFVLFLLTAAFVLLVSQCFYERESQYPRENLSIVNYYCAEYGVDSNLVYAVMKQESNFQSDAISHKGASGLMQLMPETASWICTQEGIDYDEEKLTDPTYNLRLGIWFLAYLNNEFDNETPKVIAAYNAGDGSVKKWLKNETWNGTTEDASSIPFHETASYLKKVSDNYEKYQEIY